MCSAASDTPSLRQLADPLEPGVLADRRGARATQLDAVVLRRVVARREHRARQAEPTAGEIELVGGSKPDVHDVRAAGCHAVGECLGQWFGRRAHVMPDNHRARPVEHLEHVDDRTANRPSYVFVELVGNDTADVIRLDDCSKVTHARTLPSRHSRVGIAQNP